MWYSVCPRAFGKTACRSVGAQGQERFTMAVPKQKKGRGATHTRRSANSKLATPARSECPRCGAPKLPHHVCPSCGYYKDREILVVE